MEDCFECFLQYIQIDARYASLPLETAKKFNRNSTFGMTFMVRNCLHIADSNAFCVVLFSDKTLLQIASPKPGGKWDVNQGGFENDSRR